MKTLVLLLHGYANTPGQMKHVESAIKDCIPDAQVVVPKLPLGTVSFAGPVDITLTLLEYVDELWRTGDFHRLVMVGHSVGGLFCRKVYIAACGSNPLAPLEPRILAKHPVPKEWAAKVDRIILLAGMNNGWSIDYHMPLKRVILMSVAVFLARLAMVYKEHVLFSFRRGAPFLTALRIQWLAMRRVCGSKEVGGSLVVQLLGTTDDLVSPADNIDLVTGHDFRFLDVPRSGHSSVINMDSSPHGRERRNMLAKALTESEAQLSSVDIPMSFLTNVVPNHEVDEVAFVIHGIRDEGFWTERIARTIVKEGKTRNRRFAYEASSYGFFGMIPFVFPWRRRQKVEWLMNKYAEALARYPNAERFHFVGHSNGTFLLARALEDYPSCHFDRVVFAGSVVTSRFDWSKYLRSDPPQVRQVLNYAATADWVVAWFPNAMELMRAKFIGGAGHRGFVQDSESVVNIEYVVGAHSAALQEDNWQAIAEFVVHGTGPKRDLCKVDTSLDRSGIVQGFGYFPPLIWLAIVLMLLIFPFALFHWQSTLPEWLLTLILVSYILAVWKAGNQF